jgi:hypothetical protein
MRLIDRRITRRYYTLWWTWTVDMAGTAMSFFFAFLQSSVEMIAERLIDCIALVGEHPAQP